MLEKIGLTKKHIKALLLILFALAITSLFTCAVTPPESLPKKEVAKVTNANQKEKGVLKVLTWAGRERLLSRQGLSHETELDHLKLFAESKGLNFEEVSVFRFSDLIPKLLAGEGDIISANLTITSERKKLLDFSLPFASNKEFLVMGKKSITPKKGKNINGRTIYIQKGKSYEITAKNLQKAFPKLTIAYIDNRLTFDQIYTGLAIGKYDLTIQDDNLIKHALAYRSDIKKGLQVSGVNEIAWAIAPNNKKLLTDINHFLKMEKLVTKKNRKKKKKHKNKWAQIKADNTIRFVMRNNLSSYYIWKGELLGFHFELAKRFAKENHLRYEIIVAPENHSILDYILEDKADIALSFLTPTQTRRDMGIVFSRPYHYTSELLIANVKEPEISAVNELKNRKLHIRESSAYWDTAKKLNAEGASFQLVPVSDEEETETIIDHIGEGKYEMTIADGHIVNLEMRFRDDIESLIALGDPKAQSWAIKKGNDSLLLKSDQFIKKYYKGLFYNVIYNKYFNNSKRLNKQHKAYLAQNETGVLSPYDNTIKKYAQKYNFDWRLLVSQMHQESRFNPRAKSFAGAQGLFQVMPRTAKTLGVSDLYKPKNGIKAGVRYMNWVRERMSVSEIPDEELIWFTLASYNAGAGHVRDAMALARKKGWKDDVWFDNVERAMLLLSQNKYARKARYGYVRGHEPVTYVRSIKLRYETYINIESAVDLHKK